LSRTLRRERLVAPTRARFTGSGVAAKLATSQPRSPIFTEPLSTEPLSPAEVTGGLCLELRDPLAEPAVEPLLVAMSERSPDVAPGGRAARGAPRTRPPGPWRVAHRGAWLHLGTTWALWASGKEAAGKHDLVAIELRMLLDHLLIPLGVGRLPVSVADAIDRYRSAREQAEKRFEVVVPRRLEAEVVAFVQG
jgi:hypothetical protein